MSEIVIEFKNVTKAYKLFKNDKKRFLALFFKNIKYKEKKAVNNVSFKIHRGETVALFGKNGAGKSTILKLITGVCFPTSGEITVNGRVSALLELTSGFDPEFTGRENIYLKGQLLGLKNSEIEELEQTIIDFAEIEEYIDQPVRTYSSGMKARLGFSINVNIKPESLVEHLITVNDDSSIEEGDYYYIVYQNNKIYQDGHGSGAQYFYYTNESKKSYVNAPEIVAYLNENRQKYGGGDHICSTSAFDYYNEAYKFSKWVVEESKLSEIDENDLLLFEDSTRKLGDLTGDERNTYLSDSVAGTMLVPGENNNPLLSESAFNNHRLSVIRKSIETTLSVVIDNYEARNNLYDFAMPVLSDADWYKILNNVSLTTFLQGMSIGFRFYSNYAIVTNNINKEVIKPENIYIVAQSNGSREYHQPGCEKLLQGVEDNTLSIVGAYPTYGFQRQTVDINENNSVYYYPQNVSTQYLTGCYNCIVNATAEYDLQDIIAGVDLIKYYDKTENGGSGTASFSTAEYEKIRQAYMTALARERQDIYKSNINLQTNE